MKVIIPAHSLKSTDYRKDTSMTATMLLQDSMLKPSVFRSASEIQAERDIHYFESLFRNTVYIYTRLHTQGCVSERNTETYNVTHENMSYALK